MMHRSSKAIIIWMAFTLNGIYGWVTTREIPGSKPNVSHHFVENVVEVLEALRNQIPKSCLDVSVIQDGKLLSLRIPHLIIDSAFVHGKEWEKMADSTLGGSCVTFYLPVVFSKSEYKRFSILRRRQKTMYYVIGPGNEAALRRFLSDPSFKNEENIAVVSERDSESWFIHTRQIYSPKGLLKRILSNVWSSKKGFAQDADIFPEQMKNFYGFRLLGSTLEFLPLTDYEYVNNSLILHPKPSLEIFMLEVVSEKLNFTYELRRPQDGQWGIRTFEENWTGIVGDLQHERADFGLSISISFERKQVIDFSMSYYFDPFLFVTRKLRQDSRWVKMLTPLQGDVWIVLCLTFFGCCLLYKPLLKFSPSQRVEIKQNFAQTVVELFGSLVCQSRPSLPKKMSGRLFMGWWMIFSVLITCYYRTSLNAALVAPATPPTLDTLNQLLDSDLDFGINRAKGIEFSFLASSTSEVHKEIFEGLNFYDTNESMLKVNEGRYAYIYFKSTIEDIVAKQYTDPLGNTDMHLAREEIFASRYAWVFPKGASHRRTFNEVISRCLESGLQVLWLRKMKEMTLQKNPGNNLINQQEETKEVVFSMDYLKGVFATLLFGYLLSLLAFVGELLAKLRRGPKMSPTG